MAATTLMMRNLCKLNAGNFLKKTQLAPLKLSYGTFVGTPRKFTSYPLILFQNANQGLLSRGISSTVPKMAGGGKSSGLTTIWTIEKILAATMLTSVPAAFMFPSQFMDALMAISFVMHSHWGIEAVMVDYLRPNVVGHVVPKVAHVLLFLISITTLGGLFYLIHNDIGIAESIKRLWNVKRTPAAPVAEECSGNENKEEDNKKQ